MPVRICLLLLLVALTLNAPAAGGQEDPGAIDVQRIQTDDLALQIPAGWTRLNDTATILTLLSPMPTAGDSFRDNVRVKKYPLAGIDDVDRILSAQEKTVGNDFRVIGSGILSAEEPRIAWLAITEKRPEPGEPSLAKIDYLVINQGYLFVLHAMCEAGLLEERRPTFDAMARSVRFPHSSAPQQAATPKESGSENSSAYEGGRQLGRYTLYVMVAVAGAWLVFRLVRIFRK